MNPCGDIHLRDKALGCCPRGKRSHKKKKDTARSAFHDTSKMSLIQRDDSYIVPVRLFLFLQHDQQKESSSCPGWLLAFHRRYHYWCNAMIIRFRKSVSAKKIEFFFLKFSSANYFKHLFYGRLLSRSRTTALTLSDGVLNDDGRLFLWLEPRRLSFLEEVMWLIVVFYWASRVTSSLSLARYVPSPVTFSLLNKLQS